MTMTTVTVQYVHYADGRIDLDAEEGETTAADVTGRVEFDVILPAVGQDTLTFAGHRVITKRGKATAFPGGLSWPQRSRNGSLTRESFSVTGVLRLIDARPAPAEQYGADFQFVAASERDMKILRALSDFDHAALQDAMQD